MRLSSLSVLSAHLHRRGPVGVAEHGVHGVGQRVGLGAVVLRQRQQEGQEQQEQQEQLERQRHPQDAPQPRRPGGQLSVIRRGGTGSSGAAKPAGTHVHAEHRLISGFTDPPPPTFTPQTTK